MRLGFHLEDESDKSVLKAFIKKLTGHEVNSSEVFSPDEDDVLTGRRAFRGGRLRLTGDSYVLGHVEAACRDFHARYFRGMILGVDNDEAEPRHEDGHEGQEREFAVSGCRHCSVKIRIPKKFSPRKPEVDPFLPIISVPVEMLEAWVLFLNHLGSRRDAGSLGLVPERNPQARVLSKEGTEGTAVRNRESCQDSHRGYMHSPHRGNVREGCRGFGAGLAKFRIFLLPGS
jgi:hypothetical protein